MLRIPSRTSARGWLLLPTAALFIVLAACADLTPDAPTGPMQETVESPRVTDLTPDDLGPAIAAARRYSAALMANPNIVGTGVGLNDDGEPSVRLFLVHGQVPNLPEHLDGIPVSSRVTGNFVLRQDRTARARPAPVGFSVGHPDITAGTIGARVTDGTNVYLLSNNHVIANSNNASIGDPILQPGAFDGGSQPGDVIGTLADFEPISFSSNNVLDAAIALVDGADLMGTTPDGAGYGAPSTTTAPATVGMGVQKYGRTTGHTIGQVAETNVTVSICFETRGPFQCARSATFVNQISITDGSFSDGGDSGSLIVTNNSARSPVGLLFAGSATRTLANPIDAVLERFGVSIDPTVPGDSGDPEDPEDPEDPGDDDEVDNDPVIDTFDLNTRTSGPWNRATIQWAVSHPDGALATVTFRLLDSGGGELDSQTVSVSGSSASGENELRSRSTPTTVEITVTDTAGNSVMETEPF